MQQIKPYCLMPWIHLHVGFKGQVNACCVSSIVYGNINRQSISQIWESSAIEKVRSRFLTGEPDNRCKVCINRELSGAKSLRQETFEKFPNTNLNQIKGPIYFDIRFTNVCNFKCRTCWHGASSKWFNDAKLLGTNITNQAIIKNIKDFSDFISQNESHLKNAKEIYFAGGEPLVTEEHYLFLDYLIKHNLTHIRLRYNTNFSTLTFKNYHILNYWKKFKSIEVMASIDESNGLGEYIRHGLDWNQFIENREKINNLTHISFKIAPTISVFNVKTLPDFYKTCLKLNLIKPSNFYVNILERPYHYNIKSLSLKDKGILNETYNNFDTWCLANHIPQFVRHQFKSIKQFLNGDDLFDAYHSKFLEETKQLDTIRDEDFKIVTP